ncbi:hypothetical protein HBH53_246400 [Parastagonospora nodorum]|nr:hypothetical protein HBH53_246400 [Parastagonospora nodorum]
MARRTRSHHQAAYRHAAPGDTNMIADGPKKKRPRSQKPKRVPGRPHCDVQMRARCDNTSPQGTLQVHPQRRFWLMQVLTIVTQARNAPQLQSKESEVTAANENGAGSRHGYQKMPSTTVSQLSSNQSTDPSDLSVQELKRLLGEKTEEKRSATNVLSPFSSLPHSLASLSPSFSSLLHSLASLSPSFAILRYPSLSFAKQILAIPEYLFYSSCDVYICNNGTSHSITSPSGSLPRRSRRYEHDRRRPKEETPEESETEEGSWETALRRSNARAVRQHEPSRHIASSPTTTILADASTDNSYTGSQCSPATV